MENNEEDDDMNERNSGEEDNLDDLRLENEIRKIKMSLEHGAKFNEGQEDIPPELESRFLDYIQQFENAYSESSKITIFELIGSPSFIPESELSDAEVETALDVLIHIMGQHDVIVDTVTEVEDRELYRFITEEMFKLQTNDIKIEGMKQCFIYEEFHPNHEFDIKSHCFGFVNSVLDKEKDWMPEFLGLAKQIETAQGEISIESFIYKMELFRDSFCEFRTNNFEIISVKILEEEAVATFDINYNGTIEGSEDEIIFEGTGNIYLKSINGYWSIYKVDLPGLVI